MCLCSVYCYSNDTPKYVADAREENPSIGHCYGETPLHSCEKFIFTLAIVGIMSLLNHLIIRT